MSAIDQNFGIISRFDQELNLIYANSTHPDSDINQIITKNLIEYWKPFIKTVFQTEKYESTEFCINGTFGKSCYQSHFIPEFDQKNKLNSVVVISQDITKFKDIDSRIDQFISMASHELKTPVTSIKIFSEIISRSVHFKKDQIIKSYLNKMKKQINRLNNLVDVFLDIAKVKNDTLKLNFQKFSLNKLILESIETLNQTVNFSHPIIYRCSKTHFIVADKQRIKSVIVGLLSNATKYSPEGNEIIISSQVIGKCILVSVQDFGVGIEKKYQQKIFDKFYRIYNDFDQTFPGLGIGLYSASTTIKLHGGSISVNSKLGQGSTFSFTIPQSPSTTKFHEITNY